MISKQHDRRKQINTDIFSTMIEAIKRNGILLFLVLMLIALTFLRANGVRSALAYYQLVEWDTVGALAGIIMITTAIKESNFLDTVAKRILHRATSERGLAILMLILSALLSSLITNDMTLFVVLPLIISLQDKVENDISKMVIYVVIAVNVGSALTPIGNPQNLLLWYKWGVSFTTFILNMLPLFIILIGLLLFFTVLSFGTQELRATSDIVHPYDKRLVIFSFVLLGGYIVALELKLTVYALPVVTLVYLLFYRDALRKTDWSFLLIFIVMFVDFHLITEIGPIAQWMEHLVQTDARGVFVHSLLISQVISNVPAAVFVSKFSHNWRAIAYGVNVGGNGLAIASFSNLIALKMLQSRKTWIRFHKYSLAYLLVSACFVYFLLF